MASALRRSYREIRDAMERMYFLAVARGGVYGNGRLDGAKGFEQVSDVVNSAYDMIPYHGGHRKTAMMDEGSAVDMFKRLKETLSADDIRAEYARINGEGSVEAPQVLGGSASGGQAEGLDLDERYRRLPPEMRKGQYLLDKLNGLGGRG